MSSSDDEYVFGDLERLVQLQHSASQPSSQPSSPPSSPPSRLINFPLDLEAGVPIVDSAALPGAVSRRASARQAAQGPKIVLPDVVSTPNRPKRKRTSGSGTSKHVDNPKPRVEVAYPRGGMKPVYLDHASAACFDDFVSVFCKTMWHDPNIQAIEDALKVAFKQRQSRYGKIIIPDNLLKDLLETAKALPKKWDDSKDESFEHRINSAGWRLVKNLMVQHEMLIIALMSISSFNWSTIKNRHQWHNFKEQNQNRCARQKISLFFLTLFQGNGVLQALDYRNFSR
jgi:hypothetical protein